MNIREIHENKKQFLPLLLLADEQENTLDDKPLAGRVVFCFTKIPAFAPKTRKRGIENPLYGTKLSCTGTSSISGLFLRSK